MSDKRYPVGGAFPSKPDRRDFKVQELISCARLLPDEYKTKIPTEVWNQGESNTCVACSLTLLRYIFEYNQSKNRKRFSPKYLYGNRLPTDHQGEGMYPRQALDTLLDFGVPHAKELPGFDDYPNCAKAYKRNKEALDKLAHPFRISSYYRVNTQLQAKNAIMKLGGVSAMFPVFNCLYKPEKSGYVKYTPSFYKPDGYHQMTLIGWTKDNHWIVQNSWGKEWGKDGIGYIPYSYPITEMWAIVDEITEIMFEEEKK